MDLSIEMDKTLNFLEKNKINYIIDILKKEILCNKPENISEFCRNYIRINSKNILEKIEKTPVLEISNDEDEVINNNLIVNQFKNKRRKGILKNFVPNKNITKNKIKTNEFKNISKINLFKELTNEQKLKLKSLLIKKDTKENEIIVNYKENIDNFYFILNGIVIVKKIENNKEIIKKILNPGDYFNEICLLHKSNSLFKIISKKNCNLLKLSNEDYLSLTNNNSKKKFENFCKIMNNINLQKTFYDEELSKLFDCLAFKEINAGNMILKQGDMEEKLYIIFEGTVGYFKYNLKNKIFYLEDEYKNKKIFNQEGFLFSEKTNHSIFAESKVNLGILSKEKYNRLIN